MRTIKYQNKMEKKGILTSGSISICIRPACWNDLFHSLNKMDSLSLFLSRPLCIGSISIEWIH